MGRNVSLADAAPLRRFETALDFFVLGAVCVNVIWITSAPSSSVSLPRLLLLLLSLRPSPLPCLLLHIITSSVSSFITVLIEMQSEPAISATPCPPLPQATMSKMLLTVAALLPCCSSVVLF